MKKNSIAFIIVASIFFFSVVSVSGLGWFNNTFNNSQTTEDLIFTGNINLTRYLAIPDSVNYLTSAFFNLTGLRSVNEPYNNSNLVVYYTMDAITDGNLTEITKGIKNGTIYGNTTVSSTGLINNSYNFSTSVGVPFGSSPRVEMGDLNGSTNITELTLSAWFNTSNFHIGNIVAKRGGGTAGSWRLYVLDNTPLRIAFDVINITGAGGTKRTVMWETEYNDSQWHHFVGVYNVTHLSLFYDGVLVNKTTHSGRTQRDTSSFNIGGKIGSPRQSFEGHIDEVGVWNRSLSATEISEIYNSGSGLSYFSTFPNNATVKIGTIGPAADWNFTGEFSQVNNKTKSLLSIINSYLVSCTAVSNNCLVPFQFHSDIVGTISYLDLVFGNKGLIFNSQNFTNITYESSTEQFSVNISYDNGEYTGIGGELYYNGTAYTGTRTGSGTEAIFTRALNIPDVTMEQNHSFHWQIGLTNTTGTTYFNSSFNNQTVRSAILSYCGTNGTSVPYLNFTFLDEADNSALSAANDLTDFDFWIGVDSSGAQEYIFSNVTANPSYAFCFDPPDTSVNVDLTFKYSASGYPIRTFQYDDQVLSNATANQALYLLATADGIYSTIQTTESLGTPIAGTTLLIERRFSGVWTTIEQGVTGTDGASTFWVNPNFDHRITATKTGYSNVQVTIRPSQATYTIIMSASSGNATFSSDFPGVKWVMAPRIGRIDPGSTNFNVSVTAANSNLENCKLELLEASNTSNILATATSFTNSTSCKPSFDFTLVQNQNVFGRLSIDTTATDGFIIVDTDWKWVVADLNATNWRTLTSFFADLKTLSEFGEGNEREFSRYIFFFMLSTIFIAIFFHFSGFEISNPGSSVIIIWFIILLASVSGFLSFNSGSNNIDSVWEQYAFLLMFSLMSIGYMLNRWRKENE